MDDPDRADPEERVILEVAQPTDSHNGGHIEFGPDGYLYMGIGDGGGPEGEPRYDHGQDLTTLLGTILRIDVDSVEEGYAIPADNPFAGNDRGWREEIWAYGLRNPWSFSFDPVSGLIWVGDVGERNREEIDLVERGGNYGWARMEGNLCRDPEGCDDSLIPPVFEYGREEGLAVIGGFVYQGSRWPGLAGRYLFGDFGTRRLWALRRDGEAWSSELLAVADEHILAFGRDAEDELYVLARNAVYRLESAAGRELPRPRLSETGVFSSMRSQEPASGVMPYEVNAPLWSDGAGKKRYLVLPEEGRIRFRSDGAWEFPDGTVLVKSFYVGELIAETRLLIKRTGYPGWDGYSYKWNADRNEAFLLEVARTGEYRVSSPDGPRTHQHYFPSRGQCGDCHTPASGYVLGLRTGQMNRDGLIESWEREGLFDGELPPPREWAKWPEPADESLPLEPAGPRLPRRQLRQLPSPGPRHPGGVRPALRHAGRRDGGARERPARGPRCTGGADRRAGGAAAFPALPAHARNRQVAHAAAGDRPGRHAGGAARRQLDRAPRGPDRGRGGPGRAGASAGVRAAAAVSQPCQRNPVDPVRLSMLPGRFGWSCSTWRASGSGCCGRG